MATTPRMSDMPYVGTKPKNPPPPSAPPAKPAVPGRDYTPPAQPATPVVAEPNYYGSPSGGGGYSGGGGGSYGGYSGSGVGTTPTGTVAPQSKEEFLASDSDFLNAKAALEREYANMIAQLKMQAENYQQDIGKSFRDLGWDKGAGQWNKDDKLTAYGQSYNNQMGDFASRGMLDSSLFGQAQNDLNRGFDQQRSDLEMALEQMLSQQELDKTQAKSARDAAIKQAREQALARMTAMYGL